MECSSQAMFIYFLNIANLLSFISYHIMPGSCISSTTRMRCGTLVSTDTEEKKLLNKIVIFVFFVHKKYFRSFLTLQLNH